MWHTCTLWGINQKKGQKHVRIAKSHEFLKCVELIWYCNMLLINVLVNAFFLNFRNVLISKPVTDMSSKFRYQLFINFLSTFYQLASNFYWSHETEKSGPKLKSLNYSWSAVQILWSKLVIKNFHINLTQFWPHFWFLPHSVELLKTKKLVQ